MKILVFNRKDVAHPAAGGAEIYTHEITKRWAQRGHEVNLVASRFPGSAVAEEVDKVRIYRAGNLYTVFWEAVKLAVARKLTNCDVIVDQYNVRPFLLPRLLPKAKKIVFWVHQCAKEVWHYEVPLPFNWIGYWKEKSWFKSYRHLPTVAVSPSTRVDLMRLGFKQVYTINPAVNHFKPASAPKTPHPTLLYLGRFTRAKRINLLLNAFYLLRKQIPRLQLWLAGRDTKGVSPPPQRALKIWHNVTESQKAFLLAQAWILVNPSVREGWGINILEANLSGTPCVAFNVPGLRDSIKHYQTGLLTPHRGGANNLARTLARLLQNHSLRERLGVNAKNYARKFSWHNTADQFLEILCQVAAKRN